MALLLFWLLLHPADARPVSLHNWVVGQLLVVSVEAGLPPEQVEKLFGSPDWLGKFTSGPPRGAWTTLTYGYRRYGVTVSFLLPPWRPVKERCLGEPVRGGIE